MQIYIWKEVQISKITRKLPTIQLWFLHLGIKATPKLNSKSPLPSSPWKKWPMAAEFWVWLFVPQWASSGLHTHPRPSVLVLGVAEFRMCDHAWTDDKFYEAIIKSTCCLAPSDMPTWLMLAHQWSQDLICWPSGVIKTLPTLSPRTWWETW